MIDTKDILYKHFELHEKPSTIAKELNVVPSYVTKVVQKDDRYNEEKEYRLNLNKEKRKKDKRNWIRNKRQNDANMVDDKRTILLKDKTKNKSSYRSLPLMPEIKEALLLHKKKIEHNRKLCGNSYITEYKDYICVNEIGKIFRPEYITDHFSILLKKQNLRHICFHRITSFLC